MRRLLATRLQAFPTGNAGKKNFKKLVLCFILATASFAATAAAPLFAHVIKGQVKSTDGSPLAGVTVTIKGTSIAVTTDSTGYYAIEIPDDQRKAVLVFSSVGFTTQEALVGARTGIDVQLQTDIKNLNDVVVVGYGTQKRKDLTGAISSVAAAQIAERPVSSYTDALAGVAPGIDVSPRSARPGNVPEIRIRGIGSISGDTEPLYVVDGFPTDAINAAAINPSDINSIDILKDASATAIYGSRGSNGVVIITTKSGKSGQSRVDVSLKQGISKANKHNFYHVLNGEQYVEWYKEKAQFAGTAIPSWVTNYDGKTN
ncbi:MAG TPA: TonB-dependent receptor plug domain-containing protein, partial [Puia sp.]